MTSVVAAVTISVEGATLTRMDTVITRKVEIAVRSITGSSGHELKNSAQNPDQREFLSGTGNTPLITASIRSKLFINRRRIDETRKTKLLFQNWNSNKMGKRRFITKGFFKNMDIALKIFDEFSQRRIKTLLMLLTLEKNLQNWNFSTKYH